MVNFKLFWLAEQCRQDAATTAAGTAAVLKDMTNAMQNVPPKLQKSPDGEINANSLADLVEWFLNYDEKVALVRHPNVEELFQWKQTDDGTNGAESYPFENAEARFAIGVFRALAENKSESELNSWLTDVIQALGESKETSQQFTDSYKLGTREGKSHISESKKIPSKTEQRLYLSSCWLEALCTAEARILGWVYQELYGKPFQPN